ncbi:MAG: hypothetical protein FJ029_08535, partial [Actinobacteria bacterium]|nr:hypothetical protein [Actinomycetota bacterium]
MLGKAVFTAARVADAQTNGWLADHAVIVEDGRIAAVVARHQLPTDIAGTHTVYALGEVALLPGLIETHVHLHFPAHPDYKEISRPEPVERLCIRAATHVRTLLLSG